MQLDIGNALDSVATPGVSTDALDRLDDAVADAHETIAAGMSNARFGYASLNLPETTSAAGIERAVDSIDADAVLTVGIGGSALGAKTITAALGEANHYLLDNVDPEATNRLLNALDFESTAINVVSKSGTTAETLANFLVVRDAYEAAGVDWTERTVVTTGESGPLAELAAEEELPKLAVPDGVPGRFSALSAVGLVAPAILGYDIEAVLDGGREARDSLTGSIDDCPAYAYGALAVALERRGVHTNAFMPYAEALEPFAEWFAQLWGESLGKDGQGQTPARALGATDQHSQLQLYRAGRHDTMVTLVRPTARDDREIPAVDVEGLAYLGDATLGDLLDAEFEATEASLAAADKPSVRVELDRVDEHGIGDLLVSFEAACIMAGELMGVETFTQPAVEWGKNAARGLLGGEETAEAAAVRDKREYRIE
ncbi:glucose-6-phosphate isomerase [Halosegnis longus]|uniref:glucose-6-phosphate isomerase n=1 Tax=Halosegnis longus TaxID=2216012 RepID=UPI00129E780D|nr:glucose-6-phosphate isomerase [Halosegnis longus]